MLLSSEHWIVATLHKGNVAVFLSFFFFVYMIVYLFSNNLTLLPKRTRCPHADMSCWHYWCKQALVFSNINHAMCIQHYHWTMTTIILHMEERKPCRETTFHFEYLKHIDTIIIIIKCTVWQLYVEYTLNFESKLHFFTQKKQKLNVFFFFFLI